MNLNMFLDEASTQKTVLKDVFDYYNGNLEKVILPIKNLSEEKSINRVIFTGMGSSLYACKSVPSLFKNSKFEAFAYDSYDLKHYNSHLITDKTLLVCVSQSGNSWEINELLEAIETDPVVVGLYNYQDCLLAPKTANILPINAGKEVCITSKTYQASILILNILSHYLLDLYNDKFVEEVEKAIDWNANWFDDLTNKTKPLHDIMANVSAIDFVGDGPSISTAWQSALIYREGPRLATTAIHFSDYAHGFYLNGSVKDYTAFYFIPEVSEHNSNVRMINKVTTEQGQVVLLTKTGQTLNFNENVHVIELPGISDSLLPLCEIVPLDTIMGFFLGLGWYR